MYSDERNVPDPKPQLRKVAGAPHRRSLAVGLTFAIIAWFSVAPAYAITIDLSFNHTAVAGSPSFYTLNSNFSLPTGFSDASLTIQALGCDDRCVVQLNGTTVTNAGIFGPGTGSMTLTSGGSNDPFTFTFGNGTQNLPVNSGFVTGLNTLLFIVNDTNSGIFGTPLGSVNISGVNFTGSVTFNAPASGVPDGGTTGLLMGLGMLGLAAARRRLLRR